MSKLHTLDITLGEDKELVGVRTNGNTITIVYSIYGEYRPIGFAYHDNDGDAEEIEDRKRK